MKIKGVLLPEGLREQTYIFMKDIITRLDREKRLDRLDSFSLYVLAGNINTYLVCEERLISEGPVYINSHDNEVQSVYFLAQSKVQAAFSTILKEMGLTLGSRMKMKMPDEEEESLAERIESALQ